MKIQFPRFILFLYLTLEVVCVQAQWTTALPSSIRIDEIKDNHLLYFGNAEETYKQLFDSLNRLILKGDCGIHIVQIGDSHIQAGFFPEQMRKNFSTFLSSGCGARGLIFPYRIAKTNNPIDYSVKFSGKWEHCRNVEVNKNCGLGLMGIMAQTNDSVAVISFHFKESSTFREFNFIRIFHDPLDTSFRIDFPGLAGLFHLISPLNARYSEIRFDSIIKDSLRIRIVKKDTTRNR